MKRFRFCILAVGLALLIVPSLAWAQLPRTFVSGSGNDGNPCTRDLPCRTIPVAINAVEAKGEVVVLDSADYSLSSSLTVTKAVSVIAPPGVYAGISFPNGITVLASAFDVIVFRGLTMKVGFLTITSAAAVHIENCFFRGAGIRHQANGHLFVKDSAFTGSTTFIIPINVSRNGSGTARASIDRVRLEGNTTTALLIGAGAKVVIRDSVVSGNTSGILGGPSGIDIENCLVSNNSDIGIRSEGGTVRVSNSTVTGNNVGLWQLSGTLLSRINNTVEGNTTDISGAVGSYNPK